jgi:hypothetical protein
MAFKVFYIPNAPENLQSFFPDLDFSLIASYQIQVLAGGVIAESSINNLTGECCEDNMRIHFLNFLGAIDAINVKPQIKEFEAKSDRYTAPTPWPLIRSQHGINRFNVKANEPTTVQTDDYPQEDNYWINELIASPLAWLEWTPEDSAAGADYLPIVIEDIKIQDQTETDRFENRIRFNITYSYDKFIIRN